MDLRDVVLIAGTVFVSKLWEHRNQLAFTLGQFCGAGLRYLRLKGWLTP